MGGTAGLHHLRGRWIELDPARDADALRHWKRIEAAAGSGPISFADGMRLLAGLPPRLTIRAHPRRVDRRHAQDPFPQVDGAGLARLRAAGIAVECGLLDDKRAS